MAPQPVLYPTWVTFGSALVVDATDPFGDAGTTLFLNVGDVGR
jgi:hypothetical protein